MSAPQLGPRRVVRFRDRGRRQHGRLDQRPVFSAWSRASASASTASSVTSRYWPPIIPSVASVEDAGHGRRPVGEREPERLGQERVAREDRDVLAVRDVRARASAAQVVVVQGREIVVDEAERVHELERAGGREQLLGIAAERLAGREAEHGPDPLAAAEERVADRLGEPAQLLGQRESGQPLLDERAELVRRCIALGRLAPEAIHLVLHLARQLGHRREPRDGVLGVLDLLELAERGVELREQLLELLPVDHRPQPSMPPADHASEDPVHELGGASEACRR